MLLSWDTPFGFILVCGGSNFKYESVNYNYHFSYTQFGVVGNYVEEALETNGTNLLQLFLIPTSWTNKL